VNVQVRAKAVEADYSDVSLIVGSVGVNETGTEMRLAI